MNSRRALISLIETYHELNSSTVDELPTIPTALGFHRYVAKNRPFIVRNGARDWKATRLWNAKYLRETMRSRKVKVAITPLGNADAVVEDQHGRIMFVEPYEIDEGFEEFLDYVQIDSSSCSSNISTHNGNVKYAQTQNDNLRAEYEALFADVPPTIPFATEALEQQPDAINFWLGNHRSTTALHKDNYENIYVQIRGQKHFTLLPPVEAPSVNDVSLDRGRYRPGNGSDATELIACPDETAEPVPVATWDPDDPEHRPSEFSRFSRPTHVTLNEGDMMYLPALWYHKVGQSNGKEGFACSVNYWFDMSFDGGFWSTQSFIRDVVSSMALTVEYPELIVGDDNDAKRENVSTR
ncbi:Clavaminate synthase-like protein [Dissoconium aciculare CBS 342.82]|uniref:Clavaminate synthase-like protein n=1 Tax=Dissoconium aciculare CBS 342.82 TaxID=1314786 RepID=A0A6J3MG43_9PEZI|nr:Clavaminate synthase-like protein [Dissoconium aciculare CBS 342.82]KAF1826946.1 Clavaminate synthase-like protein [Dissoconium aciculare CBS 342.82]